MHTREQLYINGQWVDATGEGDIQVIDPATEELVGSVPVGSSADVDVAVSAARRAFPEWSQSTLEERADILNRLSALFKERGEELAQLITSEVGTPIGYSRMAMVGTPRVVLRSYAKLLADFEFEEEIRNSLVVKEPIGVCAMITPWNFPLHQIIGKVAPAIAAGCTMVLKPSREAPLNAFVLADMLDELGLPAGVFNLVSGHGSVVGQAMAAHLDVDLVSFTGSTDAGVRVSEAAAPSVKRVTLELGGKSATSSSTTRTSPPLPRWPSAPASPTPARPVPPSPACWCRPAPATRWWTSSPPAWPATLWATRATNRCAAGRSCPPPSRPACRSTSPVESKRGRP